MLGGPWVQRVFEPTPALSPFAVAEVPMPGSPVVTEIHVKASNKGGRELEAGVTACPLHEDATVTTKTRYRR